MGSRSRTSRRRSAASYRQRRLEEAEYFLDECVASRSVAASLRVSGFVVHLHTEHFPRGAEDEDWLPKVGRRGWILLTKDSNPRYHELEVEAIRKYGVRAFILRGKDLKGTEVAGAFIAGKGRIHRLIRRQDPPFVATVSSTGGVKLYRSWGGPAE